MARTSEEYTYIEQELTHEWMNVDDVYSRMYLKIPPGKALRKYQDAYSRYREKNGLGEAVSPMSQDEQISSGRRHIFNDRMHSGASTGTFAIRTVNGVRQIRLNRFTAEQIDAILAKAPASSTPVPDQPAPVVVVEQHVSAAPSPQVLKLMYNHRNVQRDIEITPDDTMVKVLLHAITDTQDLELWFNTTAADWVSDRMGLAAIAVRGEEGRGKLIRPDPKGLIG